MIIFRSCLVVTLESILNLKGVFEKKKNIWQNLGNTFKNMLKNYLQCFLKKIFDS